MQNRTAIIIVAAALVIFAYIYFVERDSMTSSELEGRKGRVFAEYKRELVTTLELERAGEERVVVEKTADPADGSEEWSITSPRALAADAAAVRSVLSAIDFLLADRTVTEAGAAKDERYGLEAPRVRGAFTIKGEKVAFRVGADDSSKEKVYLAVDGRAEFHAVERSFLEAVDVGLDELRDKHLVDTAVDGAIGVVVSRGGKEVRLSRDGEGPWRLARGEASILAAADQVNELLGRARGLLAKRFVADGADEAKLASAGLGSPTRRLAITLEGGREVAVALGSPCGDDGSIHATVEGSGVIACVAPDIAEIIDRPESRFEELRLAVFSPDDVEKITIAAGKSSLALERDDEERRWRLVGDGDTEIDDGAVKDLLTRFGEARAVELVAGEEAVAALAGPIATVRLDLDSGGEPAVIELFGAAGDEIQTARRQEESAVLKVKADLLGVAVADPLAFRRRVIETAKGARVVALEVEGPAAQRLERGDDGWRVVSPLEVAADGQQADKVEGMFTRLEVERFAAKSAQKAHGLDAPWARIRATLEREETGDAGPGSPSSATLEIGAVADGAGARYARFAGANEAVFVLGPATAELASRPLVARDRLQLPTEGIVRLELRTPGGTLDARLSDGEWRSKDRSDLDAVAVKRLLADLAAVKAVSVRSFGAAPAQGSTLELRAWKDGEDAPFVILFGPRSPDEKEDAYLARREGLDVTFAVAGRLVDDLVSLASPAER